MLAWISDMVLNVTSAYRFIFVILFSKNTKCYSVLFSNNTAQNSVLLPHFSLLEIVRFLISFCCSKNERKNFIDLLNVGNTKVTTTLIKFVELLLFFIKRAISVWYALKGTQYEPKQDGRYSQWYTLHSKRTHTLTQRYTLLYCVLRLLAMRLPFQASVYLHYNSLLSHWWRDDIDTFHSS